MSLQSRPLPHRLPSSILDFGDNSGPNRHGDGASEYWSEALQEKLSPLDSDPEKVSVSLNTSETEFEHETNAGSAIVYHYLEFETKLPPPAARHPNSSAAGAEPKQPNLTKYGSPFEWSDLRKSFIVWLSTASTLSTAYAAGSYASGVDQMSREWHVSNVAVLVGITVFTVGFGIGPMFTAPFSELNGRRPVFVSTGILFVVCQACCAITRSYYGMILARFWTGVAASTFATMVGGVISDIYHAKKRNTPMSIYTGGVFMGTGLGPLASGFIGQHLDWRWIFYVQIMSCGVIMGAVVLFFPETRGSVLLSRKAKLLNNWYEAREQAGYYGFMMPLGNGKEVPQRIRWKVKADEERGTLMQMLMISLFRPLHLLFTEPVVFFFSLWISFSWGMLYMTFIVVPLIFETVYGFNLQETGAAFASICAVSIIFTIVCIYQDKLALRLGKLNSAPEGRLFFPCAQSILMPVGLFWLGWTIYPSIHWIVPIIGLGAATMGIMSIYLCVFNYLADTYHRYASSALAAQSFSRNILCGAFPLFTDQMFRTMGFHAALSFLGGVGLVLTIVPWVLLFYGVKIRARSKFASEIMK